MEEKVKQGQFRQDVGFWRKALDLHGPPLRRRESDLLLPTHAILQSACAQVRRPAMRWSPSAIAALRQNPWRGNARQRKNLIFRAVTLGKGLVLETHDLALAHTDRADRAAPAPRTGTPYLSARGVRQTLLHQLYAQYPLCLGYQASLQARA